MNTPSPFELQHPLSPKKFQKKLISRSLIILFASIVLGGVSTIPITAMVVSRQPQNGLGAFLWISVLLIIAFFALIMSLYGAYVSAYIRRYYYDASEQFLTIQKGVFAPTEIHVPYVKIQDVYVDQDILDRLLGIYDVHIASATVTSGIEAHIDGVDPAVAEALKIFLLNKIQYGSAQPLSQTASVSAAQSSTQQVIAQGPQAGRYTTKNYPIANGWLVAAFAANIFTAALYSIIIWGFFLGKHTSIFTVSIGQFVMVYAILYIGLAIWTLLWKATFSFEFLPQFILMKDGVLKREEKHVPYRTLQNVLLKQGLIERILGLSTVIIENAAMATTKTGRASRITIPGQPIDKGNELVNELNRILGQTSGQGTGL